MIQNNILQYLRSIPLFHHPSKEFIDMLAQQSRIIPLQKGQVLFLQGDQAINFYIVANGWIKLFRETLDGTQAVVDILNKDHIFGETAMFEDSKYPYSAEASESSEILAIPLNLLKEEIDKNPIMAKAMLSSMARYRRQQDQEIEHLTLQNSPQRIGCFLLRLINQEKSNGKVSIHLPYDKTLIASRLGMQPETFSRALNKLKSDVGITIRGSTIEIDNINQLVRYSCAACTSEFPCKDLK